jgi:hypothetical protein
MIKETLKMNEIPRDIPDNPKRVDPPDFLEDIEDEEDELTEEELDDEDDDFEDEVAEDEEDDDD